MSSPDDIQLAKTAVNEWNGGAQGERLRSKREARGLTTRQVATRLHIDPRQIEAMELDDFSSNVAPVFMRGYLRSYARFLDLPADEIIKSYDNQKGRTPAPAVKPRAALAAVNSHRERPMSWIIYLGFLATLIVGVMAWQTKGTFKFWGDKPVPGLVAGLPGSPEAESSLMPAPPSQVNSGAPPATDSLATAMPAESPVLQEPPQSPPVGTPSAPATGLADTNTAGAAAPAPVIGVAPPVAGSPVPQTPSAQAAADPVATVTAADSSVVLHATADSWVEVTDASGKRLVYETLTAGSTKTLADPGYPLKVTLGKSSGVSVEYNGKSFDHSPYDRHGVARFKLDGAPAKTGPA